MLSLERLSLLLFCHRVLSMFIELRKEYELPDYHSDPENQRDMGDDGHPQYPRYPDGEIEYAFMNKGNHDAELADCATTLDMIPKGVFINRGRFGQAGQVDEHGRPNGPDLHLWNTDRFLRPSKYLIPAAFIAGVCAVTVQEGPSMRPYRPPPESATAMYTVVWSNVRIWVQRMLDSCITHRFARTHEKDWILGWADTYSMLQGWRHKHRIGLEAAPRDKTQRRERCSWHNLYEAD